VFTATPPSLDTTGATKLCWQVNGATSIRIEPGVGSGLQANDCVTVSPTSTTTYTLTGSNANGQVQGNVTVTIGQVRILSFNASPPASDAPGSAVTLSWNTTNATSVVIVGADVNSQNLQPSGSLVVHPIANASYTLTAYGPGGQTVSVSISVPVR
jgi:hypothetical protein